MKVAIWLGAGANGFATVAGPASAPDGPGITRTPQTFRVGR